MVSLKYRVFGIPDNLEEFIDKLHQKEITQATVKSQYEHYDGSYLCGDPRSERIAPQTYECILECPRIRTFKWVRIKLRVGLVKDVCRALVERLKV